MHLSTVSVLAYNFTLVWSFWWIYWHAWWICCHWDRDLSLAQWASIARMGMNLHCREYRKYSKMSFYLVPSVLPVSPDLFALLSGVVAGWSIMNCTSRLIYSYFLHALQICPADPRLPVPGARNERDGGPEEVEPATPIQSHSRSHLNTGHCRANWHICESGAMVTISFKRLYACNNVDHAVRPFFFNTEKGRKRIHKHNEREMVF